MQFIRQIFQDKNGRYSSKRFIAILFTLQVLLIANVVTFKYPNLIPHIFDYLLIGVGVGLGVIVVERFSKNDTNNTGNNGGTILK